jgi:DNA topoisomerase-3
LVVTEKPSMGRDVAAALGAARRSDGFIQGAQDIVTWCVGHLVELDDPEAYDARLKSWRLETLPIVPERFKYHATERTRDQFEVVRRLRAKSERELGWVA